MKQYIKNNWGKGFHWLISNIVILCFVVLSLAIFSIDDGPRIFILKNLDFIILAKFVGIPISTFSVRNSPISTGRMKNFARKFTR